MGETGPPYELKFFFDFPRFFSEIVAKSSFWLPLEGRYRTWRNYETTPEHKNNYSVSKSRPVEVKGRPGDNNTLLFIDATFLLNCCDNLKCNLTRNLNMTVVFHNKSCVQSAWESHMVNTSRFLNLQHVCSLSISRYLECQNRQTVGIYISLIMTRTSAIRKPESQKANKWFPLYLPPLN